MRHLPPLPLPQSPEVKVVAPPPGKATQRPSVESGVVPLAVEVSM